MQCDQLISEDNIFISCFFSFHMQPCFYYFITQRVKSGVLNTFTSSFYLTDKNKLPGDFYNEKLKEQGKNPGKTTKATGHRHF